MLAPLIRRHRARWPLFAALLLASATCSFLVTARIFHTGRLSYTFLVHNLFLAWIPLGFAAAADAFGQSSSRMGQVLTALCAAGWLVFFPNAPYLMTDVMYLRVEHNRLFWLDLTALQAFAWTGLALGFVSLAFVQRLVARRAGFATSWLFAAAVVGASAFGIYLGRFRRWNSWDVVRNPSGLWNDAAPVILHPLANPTVIAYCAVIGAFMFSAYVVFHAWVGLRDEPEP